MANILIVGGGYAGFYTAWKLEKLLRKGEATVTMVDPLSYMTYQPFLPEVAAGSIHPAHVAVSHRRHLKTTRIISGKVTNITHAKKTATVELNSGGKTTLTYDTIIVTAGAVSRTFPIPGIADLAYGLKTVEEALAIRNRMIDNFGMAANLPAGAKRQRLLTVTVVGGGFAGIEVFAELRSFAKALLKRHPEIAPEEVKFHLVEAMSRIMPEVSLETSQWVLKNLAKRDATVHLDTQLQSAEGGKIQLSSGVKFESDLIIWTAGVMANPTVVRNSDLPVEERGRILTRADLRVGSGNKIVKGAWAAGDISAVPDLSGGGVGGYCVPNAQHAVRQAKLLARNVVAVMRGEVPANYVHKNLGAVAGLGVGVGVFQSGKFAMKGWMAWMAHRGYHGFAMPTWERKFRVFGDWTGQMFLCREIVSLSATQAPRAAFEEFASRPAGAVKAAPKKPAAKKPAAKKAAAKKAAPKKPAAKK